jgi:hypothetical protein
MCGCSICRIGIPVLQFIAVSNCSSFQVLHKRVRGQFCHTKKEDIRNSILFATTSFSHTQHRQFHNVVSLTAVSLPPQRTCLHNVLAAKAGIQEKKPCRAKQFQEMGNNLEEKTDRAGRSRVERPFRRDLRLDWIPVFAGMTLGCPMTL